MFRCQILLPGVPIAGCGCRSHISDHKWRPVTLCPSLKISGRSPDLTCLARKLFTVHLLIRDWQGQFRTRGVKKLWIGGQRVDRAHLTGTVKRDCGCLSRALRITGSTRRGIIVAYYPHPGNSRARHSRLLKTRSLRYRTPRFQTRPGESRLFFSFHPDQLSRFPGLLHDFVQPGLAAGDPL
jgi:hypothetical protein